LNSAPSELKGGWCTSTPGCARGYSYLALSEPAFIKIKEFVIRTQNDAVNSEFKKM
jgi:hypothetical protein